MSRVRFTGHIGGFGTLAGIRLVVGMWEQSPFGRFSDVMVQTPDGVRTLLAPTTQVAEFISATYSFDEVVLGPVQTARTVDRVVIDNARLQAEFSVGAPAPLDRLLRLVPGFLATAPWWLRAIDPVASRLVPGVHTAGTAGNGRREFYGVRRARLITSVSGRFETTPLRGLAELSPSVEFGFSSAPPLPQLVSVTTTIDL
ncbi:hypothetical protein BCA37_03670 [Mycobacterium sp. djl-10]|nr:hypothetical protein BCA37_03670 [Mycobacterium sp. djl-10]